MKKISFSFIIIKVISLSVLLCLAITRTDAQEVRNIELSWLGKQEPKLSTGVSWGVPFNSGAVTSLQQLELTDHTHKSLPLQSWKLAYWPDGSYKWVGLSTVVDSNSGTIFNLKLHKKPIQTTSNTSLTVKESEDEVHINTGRLQCVIPKTGDQLFSSLILNDKEISSGSQLVCILQNGPEKEIGEQPIKEKFTGSVSKVTVEQNGPVRAVVKIEGVHKSETGQRTWLPFIVRLYFYAKQQSVKLVHTIIYDGEQKTDFIRGLGLTFDVPLNEAIYNRHIRFSGADQGLWDEPVQPLVGRSRLIHEGTHLYPLQLKGERIPERTAFSKRQLHLLDHWVSWNDFKLMQDNAEGFRIQKRTNTKSVWLDAGAGTRSQGLVFAGDVSGGLAISVRNFWQSFPGALEIRGMKTNTAKIKTWLWSPDGPAMDMRHYDTIPNGHDLIASYEDVQPGHSTPKGIARTSELFLFASSKVPSYNTLNTVNDLSDNPALLTTSPEYIHEVPVFGVWSLQDRSTKGKAWIENQLDQAFDYYKKEVEQRNWYGFWDYGDVMHGYDADRHVWKYDIGGYAWDNTELMPNMWLWYNYLRTGQQDAFRMAEAMTRHTGEVDVYHLGKFNGLGSRHNVRHWGGGAKEVRISQAALGRFYYYLTTDERTGDLMEEAVEASNTAIGKLDPLRLILEKSKYPTHARVGPDWLALAGNWMTAWERTGDTKYRTDILKGVNSLYNMPYGFFSAKNAAFGYDPETKKLYQLDQEGIGYSHLSVLMGGPEVAFELTPMINSKKWDKLWLQFCRLYGAPTSVIEKELHTKAELGKPGPWYARLPAYYAKHTGNKQYAKRAWNEFLNTGNRRHKIAFDMTLFEGHETLEPIHEVKGVSTNSTAQWCLNAIELLELVGDDFPEDHPGVQKK